MACGHCNLNIDRPASAEDSALSEPVSRLSTLAARVILLGAVLLTPWVFGGVQLRDQQWLFLAVGMALALLGLRLWLAPGVALPWTAAPLGAAVLLGCFQLVPWSPPLLATLSAPATRLRTELTPGPLRGPEGTLLPADAAPRLPLSLYPAATRRELAMLLLALATFVAGSLAFATPRGGLTLCVAVAVGGAGLAFFEICQHLIGSTGWRLAWSDASRTFGPFINRNNAAGYLNLCLGAALGTVVWATGKMERSRADAFWGPGTWRRALLAPWAGLNATLLASLALAACIAAGVLCTISRGGGLALAGAAGVTIATACAARFSRLRILALAGVVAGGLALVAWVGMTAPLQARFATLLDRAHLAQARIPHWRDGLRAAAEFWPTGSGLGTYRFVYPLYQQRHDESLYVHAENQYLETLVEAGIAGLALLLAMIALVFRAAWRLVRHSSRTAGVTLGVAVVFALAGQTLQALVDFGLYIPANMLLCALLCGAAVGASASLARHGRSLPMPPRWMRGGACAATLLLVALLAWGGMETHAAAVVETAMQHTESLKLGTPASPPQIERGIDELTRAVAGRPDDAEAQQQLAELWLAHYQAEMTEALRKELPSAGATRWAELASSFTFHERAHQLQQHGWAEQLATLCHAPVVQRSLPQAAACAWAAARACPLLVDAHLVLARLAALSGDAQQDRPCLARARRVQPSAPEVLFRCGLLEFQAGRIEQAARDWRGALQLSTRRLEEVLGRAETRLSLPYLVENVLPDRPALLVALARTRYAGPRQAYARQLLTQRSARLLEQLSLADDERHYLRGAVRLLEGRRQEAVAEYEQAVALRPRESAWRYELAVLLKEQGALVQAHDHACGCVATDPRNGVYRRLLEQINHARLTGISALK
jgi:O-antigen ligase/tetratricopeptide (TPR) repeat protein